jgi:hypothetical protein
MVFTFMYFLFRRITFYSEMNKMGILLTLCLSNTAVQGLSQVKTLRLPDKDLDLAKCKDPDSVKS